MPGRLADFLPVIGEGRLLNGSRGAEAWEFPRPVVQII